MKLMFKAELSWDLCCVKIETVSMYVTRMYFNWFKQTGFHSSVTLFLRTHMWVVG